MTVRIFSKWNWENDTPEGEIPEGVAHPASRAVVFYDFWGHPYRVIVRNPKDLRLAGSDDQNSWTYEYSYARDGRILEKRSYDQSWNIALIVRFEYDPVSKEITETAWSPQKLDPPVSIRRKPKP